MKQISNKKKKTFKLRAGCKRRVFFIGPRSSERKRKLLINIVDVAQTCSDDDVGSPEYYYLHRLNF